MKDQRFGKTRPTERCLSKIRSFGRVAVLAGGPSNEREISLRSGRAVHNALTNKGLDAIFVDVKNDLCDIIKNNKFAIAFIALHGRFGEDGQVQKILEDARIPYTGSGPQASRLALDKVAAKEIFLKNSIPTPEYAVMTVDGVTAVEELSALGAPLVVKPHLEGSSIGLSVVREISYLKDAISTAFGYGNKVLIERYIQGRELTVGMLNDEPLPVVEIVTRDGLYDYSAKYKDPDTRYIVPADISNDLSRKAQYLAKCAHEALGCRSFSRVDMMMDSAGGIFVLEVNSIPGMTERSLLPKAAASCGISFGDLCVRLLEDAIKR